jgi:electron transport complex protein RnfG
MMTKYRPVIIAAVILGLFAIAGSTLVAFTHQQTIDRILENKRLALLKELSKLVPANTIDNDIVSDTLKISAPDQLGQAESTVYIGRLQGQPVAAVFEVRTVRGYNGEINLLVAVKADGTLGGVRVINHRETPGLGDKIDESRSDWILAFNGKSLNNPDSKRWAVKRDGGDFDQFTGATITPRAVVAAVKLTLQYFRDNSIMLFSTDKTAGKRKEP